MNLKYIYKIIDNDEWQKTKIKKLYKGSSKDLEDGYIHFSSEDQVTHTLKKYFKNQKNLILLKIDTLKLEHLLWEQGSDGNMYPHLYSNLDIKCVINESSIDINSKGIHILPLDF